MSVGTRLYVYLWVELPEANKWGPLAGSLTLGALRALSEPDAKMIAAGEQVLSRGPEAIWKAMLAQVKV